MKKPTTMILAAAGCVAMLALAGCSSPATVDFSQINGVPPAEEMTFEIPDELLELDPEYAENRVLKSATVKSVDLGDPKWCALEVKYDYASGDMHDQIRQARTSDSGEAPNGDDTPEQKIDHGLGLSGDTAEFGEPNKADLDEGNFLSEDGTTVTSVIECASSPTDDNESFAISFNSIEIAQGETPEGLLEINHFAQAEVVVMKSGEVSVVSTEVEDYMLDSNGAWITN